LKVKGPSLEQLQSLSNWTEWHPHKKHVEPFYIPTGRHGKPIIWVIKPQQTLREW
jgi:hypothetical protein